MAASILKITLGIMALIALLFAAYTWSTLNWAYSMGERVGYVQKMSYKGYMCKTWEGEMILVSMPGTQAEKFYFTVRDDALATQVNQLLGERVRLHYTEHKGIPLSCFGETNYFVSQVERLPTTGQ